MNCGYLNDSEHHARRWLEEVEAARGSGHRDTRRPRVALARTVRGLMRLEESELLVRGVLDEVDMDVRDPVALDASLLLGDLLAGKGEYDEAEAILRRTLLQVEDAFGPLDRLTLSSRYFLGRTADTRALVGNDEPDVRSAYRAEAAELFRQVVDGERQTGLQTAHGLYARGRLSDQACEAGRYEEAEAFAREGMALAEVQLGNAHPTTMELRVSLAGALFGMGHYQEAAAQIIRAVTWARNTERNEIQTAVNMVTAMPLLDAAGEWETALDYSQHLADRFGSDISGGGLGPEPHIWLPYLHTRVGAPEKASPLFEVLFAHEDEMNDRDRARLHYARGIWCVARNEPEHAPRDLELALELCDDAPFVWPSRRSINEALEGLRRSPDQP